MSAQEYENIQSPKIEFDIGQEKKEMFPSGDEQQRIADYEYFEKLFEGDHFDAFKIKIDNKKFGEVYEKLKYIKVNIAGLISKICADMLFSEHPTITVKDGDQEFLDELLSSNKFFVQLYESALSNSYFGDAVFKIRIGKDHPSNPKENSRIIIEDITPTIYFPEIDPFNVRQTPEKIVLAWNFERGKDKYQRQEIHEIGKITNKIFLIKGDEMVDVSTSMLNTFNLKTEEPTKVEFLLVDHIPNWKTGRKYFGYSDYYDLDSLFYAINNRLSLVDSILDEHAEPLLTLPEGILDENGRVKREKLKMIEVPAGAGSDGKPEYIVWNASLESAFSEIDKLFESLFMVSEISPDALGMGKGLSDSGRALKLKIMRTIAKITRKRLYYDQAIKDILYKAQVLAKEWKIDINGKKLTKEPVRPDIKWADGLPIDDTEQVETEAKKIDAGLTSTADAIMRIDGVDEQTAEAKAKKIQEEHQINMPTMDLGGKNPFSTPNPKEAPKK